jgi:hypothetical protein
MNCRGWCLLAEAASRCAPPEQVLRFAGALLGEYWQWFPITLMPNKVVSALRMLLEPSLKNKCCEVVDATSEFVANNLAVIPPVVEELAADIFGGGFSGKYVRAARIAASPIANTTYSRYYQLDSLLRQIVSADVDLNSAAFALRDRYYGACVGWSVRANGMLIEAGQILTTHNLIFSDDVFDNHYELPLMLILDRALQQLRTRIVASSSGMNAQRQSQHNRQVAHGFRQFVYFLSKLPPAAQLKFLDEGLIEAERRFGTDRVDCGLTMRSKFTNVRNAILNVPAGTTGIVLGWRGSNADHIDPSITARVVNPPRFNRVALTIQNVIVQSRRCRFL